MPDEGDRSSGSNLPAITPEIQLLLDAAKASAREEALLEGRELGREEKSQEHAEAAEKKAREERWKTLEGRVTILEEREEYGDRLLQLEASDASQEARLKKYATAGEKLSDSVADVRKGELSPASVRKILLGGAGSGGALYSFIEYGIPLLKTIFGG